MRAALWTCIVATVVSYLAPGAFLVAAEEPKKEAAPAAAPAGSLEIKDLVVDAGEVVRGQEAKATFNLKNTGAKEVKVLGAKPSCGCTIATFDALIEPGKTGKVEAAVHTENYRGPIEKTIALTTDDPLAANVTLRIKANVVGSVTMLPTPGLAFPRGLDWDYSGKLLLRKDETEKGELAVSQVTPSVPWLIVKTRKVQESEPAAEGLPPALPGDFILDVSVGEDAPKVEAAQTIKLKTGLSREPEFLIPVSVILQSPMRVFPSPVVIYPPVGGAKEAATSISAVVRPGLGKEPLQVTASPDAFHVKLEPDGPRKYKAIVSWKPGAPDTLREGSLVFRAGTESETILVRVAEPRAAVLPPPASPPAAAASPKH